MPNITRLIEKLRTIAVYSLARMYRPEERLFAFRLRRNGQGHVLEGLSKRYTAIALIGLAGENEHIASEVLGKHTREEVCGRLVADLGQSQRPKPSLTGELGEIALTTWAARLLRHPRARESVDVLRRMYQAQEAYSTVDLAWALEALVVEGSEATDADLAERIAGRLMESFREESGMFPHGLARRGIAALGSHVSCFADLIYPIQALSGYYQATGDARAAKIARRCAERMCQLQGPQGQWWWHYDVRTGRVVEHYPVYSVHQDAMAPMAFFALAEACGPDYFASVEKGLQWLFNNAENAGILVDMGRNVIWRKVARREPRKLVRGLQAAASRLHPALRVPAVDVAFPPIAIDHETRPYHMGWILHAWSQNAETPVPHGHRTHPVERTQSNT